MPTFKCPQCGEDFQAEHEGRFHCPHCENTLAIHLHVHGKIHWESWREKGRLRAFFETWKQVMSNPVAFFKRVPKKGNFVLPMYFGIICQSVAIILTWSFFGSKTLAGLVNLTSAFGGYWQWTGQFNIVSASIFMVSLFVVAPIFSFAGLFVTTSIFHNALRILGGAHEGFEASFRAICYSSAAQFLGAVPIVGTIIAGVWSLVLNIIGLKEIHKTTYTKASIAVLLPVFLILSFLVLVVVALFGAYIGAWMGGMEA